MSIIWETKHCLTQSSVSAIVKTRGLYARVWVAFHIILPLVRKWAERMALAPLRRIASRTLEVFSYHKNGRPYQFVIHDALECGHVTTLYDWDILDLIWAYTETPSVRARRHRCVPCAELVAQRKPVASVGLTAKQEVA